MMLMDTAADSVALYFIVTIIITMMLPMNACTDQIGTKYTTTPPTLHAMDVHIA